MHPSSLRIEGPGSVAREKPKREDRNDNREQYKQHFGASYGEADTPYAASRDGSLTDK
jgi:hypothetical protein